MPFARIVPTVWIAAVLAFGTTSIQARELGDTEGRWVYIAGSSNGAEEFIDPASIVFDKQFDAWSCWVRILDPKRREETVEKHLYRNQGQELSVMASITYDTTSNNPKRSRDAQGSPKWRSVIPDSFAENVWAAIELKNSTR